MRIKNGSKIIKQSFSLIMIAMSLIFIQCGSKKIVYDIATSQFVYEQDSVSMGDSTFNLESQEITLATFEFKESKEPLKVYVIFSASTPWIKSIEFVDLELFQKNEKGEMIKIENKKLDECTAEYFNGKVITKVPLKNNMINAQINWREVEWTEYGTNNDVTFKQMYCFNLEECPSELALKFKMKWKEKEKSFETTLTRSDYVGPKFNPKF